MENAIFNEGTDLSFAVENEVISQDNGLLYLYQRTVYLKIW